MKIIKENKQYLIIEFDDDDIDNDNDIKFISSLNKRSIKYEFIDENENIIKIYRNDIKWMNILFI